MRRHARINTIDMTPNMFFQMVHTSEKFWAYNTWCIFITSQCFRVITTNVFNTMPEKKLMFQMYRNYAIIYKGVFIQDHLHTGELSRHFFWQVTSLRPVIWDLNYNPGVDFFGP